MTPDQALDLAKFQRSGVKLIVGLAFIVVMAL